MLGMLSVLAELQREWLSPTPATASPPPAPEATTADVLRSSRTERLAQQLYDAGECTVQQIADIFNVLRTTVYGCLCWEGAMKDCVEAGELRDARECRVGCCDALERCACV